MGGLEGAIHREAWKRGFSASVGPCLGSRGVLGLVLRRGGLFACLKHGIEPSKPNY